MNDLLSQIQNYVDYLSQQGIHISIHFKKKVLQSLPEPAFSRLLAVNSHTNPYCISVKKQMLEKCLHCQKRVIEKCQRQSGFSGSCHAGVLEYIQGIYMDGVAVGYVAASGYRGSHCIPDRQKLWESALQQEAPGELLQTLLPPLERMVECLLQLPVQDSASEYHLILQYVNDHYRDLTLDTLCKTFSRSRSHISHLFNDNNSRSLRAYCNLRKLQDARQLLLHTDLSVTEIAYEAGFCDTSYFIDQFKKEFGETPYKMRRKAHS